jgi:N-acetylmuramoyl-L-alanine amidase
LPNKERSPRALKIRFIVIHCTAGFSPADKVQAFFLRKKKDGGLGWSRGGYHRIINRDGSIHKMHPFDILTNGVKGFNAESIHISYVGGVEKDGKTGRFDAKDTRNNAQKKQ